MAEKEYKKVKDVLTKDEEKGLSKAAKNTEFDTLYDLDAYAKSFKDKGKVPDQIIKDFIDERKLDITVQDVHSIEYAISQRKVAEVEGEELMVGGCCCSFACCCCCCCENA